MVTDGGAQVFEFPARGAGAAPMRGVCAARAPVHIGQRALAPPIQEIARPGRQFRRAGDARPVVVEVERDYVSDGDRGEPPTFFAGGFILVGDVFREARFSFSALRLAEAKADLPIAVPDNPLLAVGPKVEPRSFGVRAHCIISITFRSVTYSLPATMKVTSLPLSRSRRSPAAVMLPSGKNILAASARRK
jgi:hypothetical protein